MAISLKHAAVVTVPDDGVSPVGSNEWNDEHNLTLGTGMLLGRQTAGAGPVEEVPIDTWVAKAGDTMTGNLGINGGGLAITATNGNLELRKTAGTNYAAVRGLTGTSLRWQLLLSNTVLETGTNNGSNFEISRHDDVGAYIDSPFGIVRSTGVCHFWKPPSSPMLAFAPLVDAATVAVDWAASINFGLTVTADRQIGNPSNGEVGTYRTILVQGNDATARTITFAGNFLGVVPTITDCTSTKWYLFTLLCITTSHFLVTAVQAK